MATPSMQSSFTNSFPKKLTSNDLRVLCNALNDVAPKCFELGLQLGLRKTNLDIIMKNKKDDCQAQLLEIISERLKQDSPLMWDDIVRALRSPSVNYPDVARHIESWYKSPSLDFQQDLASDPQQHLSLGGERPFTMLIMGQKKVNGNRIASDIQKHLLQPPTSVAPQCGTKFSLMPEQYFFLVGGPSGEEYYQSPSTTPVGGPPQRENYQFPTQMMPVREPQHGENYQPPTQMMGQTSVRGPPYAENYQPPTQIVSQTSVRGPPYGENYQPSTQTMGQTSVRGPPHGENYQPSTQMMGETPPYGKNYQPPTEPQHGENYQPHTQMMSQTSVRGPPHGKNYQPPTEPQHGENYQPPTQMMGQTSVRGPPYGENYQATTQMMGQTPIMGPLHGKTYQPQYQPPTEPQHGDNYQAPTEMMGQTLVMRPPLGEYYQPPTQMTGQTPVMGSTHGEDYQTAYPNIHYPNLPPMLATIKTNRPLLEGVVGSQWYSQLYMSNGQLQTSHAQSHRSSSNESSPPPPTTSNSELPSIDTSSAHHYTKSSHFMDTFVDYVKSTYKQCTIVKKLNVLKWPPTPSKVFINLACIDWENVSEEEADEYTRAMVKDGNVDVIMKKKTNVDFSDIVQDLPPLTASEKVVLVEGAPGMGKSTFAWEFCRRWEGRKIAKQYQLVLLLQLRDEKMSRAKSLRDLIYHSSESVCQAVVDELEFTSGVNTLIILEGFDELPDSQRRESSIFLQLILGRLLLHATIMITSRPWATGALFEQFMDRIFLHVEILGFTEKNITKYVTSVFTGEGKKTASAIDQSVGGPDEVSEEARKTIDDVMAYIGKYPQIKACMYIPLNAAIVVSIYRESMKSKWVLPTTLTELYESLTRILLLRYLRGHAEYGHQKWSVKSFDCLPKEVYSQFLVICKTAYDGVCRERGKSIQLIFSDISDDFETLGFMQSVSQLFMDGQKTSHNFLHLTFQEFLAAFLISTKSPAEQLEHFQRHKDGRLRVVLRFLAGLTKLSKVTLDQLRSLFGEPTVEQSDEHQTPYCNPMRPDVCVSAYHTNWLFEAQNSELLQSLFHNHTASITLTRGMLPLEYYSVGYCIAHSHSKWSLTFDEDTEEEKLHMLVSGAKTGDGDYRVALKTISMTPENMNILVTDFSSNVEELYYLKIPDNGNSLSLPSLSTLHILELQIDNNKSAFNISCDLSFSSLEALIISSSRKGTTLGAKTCKAIGKLLSSTTSLKDFCLSLNIKSCGYSAHVSNKGMEVITKGLSDNRALPLKSLDIDCKCTFTTTATRSLAQFITRSTTLQYIRICYVAFSAQELIELTETIHHCSRLQEKKLEELIFHVECSEDVVNLRHMFNEYPDIRKVIDWKEVAKISRSHKYTNEINTSTLCLALEYSYLTRLDFSDMSINDAESDNLAQALHHNSTLEKLNLSNNNISDGGAVALAQSLHCNSTLKELYLSNSNINDAGAVALAQALHHNSTLETLYLVNDAIGKEGTHQLVQALTVNKSITKVTQLGGGLGLPMRCEKYATQCTQYNTVKDRIRFFL